MRGLDAYQVAIWGVFIGFYVIAIPISYGIGVEYWESINGLWLGLLIGLAFLTVFFFYLAFFHYNWDEIAQKVHEKHQKMLAKNKKHKYQPVNSKDDEEER